MSTLVTLEKFVGAPLHVHADGAVQLRTFRRYHGTTVAQYVRQRQLQQARVALATSKQPLATIALDAGFSDQAHFTRVFRHTYGETPGAYARSARRP
jgi:AraC-like DNA-binding protein